MNDTTPLPPPSFGLVRAQDIMDDLAADALVGVIVDEYGSLWRGEPGAKGSKLLNLVVQPREHDPETAVFVKAKQDEDADSDDDIVDYVEILRTGNYQYRVRAKSNNGEIIWTTEPYGDKGHAERVAADTGKPVRDRT